MMLDALHACLDSCAPAALAVSGGVDSMTLAFIAHRRLGADIAMYHAVSAAVPPAATARLQAYAKREEWDLTLVDAGEMRDERYLANPANRCFFCKADLYGTLSAESTRQLLSGTNLDDLGDWRPGLEAAKAHGVRHPYVEAEIDKGGVRRLASRLGLDDLAELPAAPCLASRIETGIRVSSDHLRAIDRVESQLRSRLPAATIRCRIRKDAIVIELEPAELVETLDHAAMAAEIASLIPGAAPVRFEPYRRGSAFLRGQHS